jgi:putative PIN family toxin of toxin-antitoxin system
MQLAEAIGIELVTSPELESELVETLTFKFGWSSQRVRQARERLWERAHWTSPEPLSGVVRDPNDNHVLAAAVTSASAFIVTGDHDLLALKFFESVRILTPADFLEHIRATLT